MTQRNCDDCYFSKLEGKKEPCKSCKATDDGFTNFREVPLTNADHIRAMSDEDLAEFLSSIAYGRETPWSEPFARKLCDRCLTVHGTYESGIEDDFHECDFVDGKCPHGSDIAWWLQQPAEEDGHG